MMKKTKYYKSVRFGSEVIKEAHDYLLKIAEQSEITLNGQLFTVVHDDSKWSYDSRDEFFSDYRKFRNGALFYVFGERLSQGSRMLFTHSFLKFRDKNLRKELNWRS